VKQAFCDVETVRISAEHGSALWECAIIVRDEQPLAGEYGIRRLRDTEYLYQVRPKLEQAEARALQVGGYYERCKVADRPVGSGMILSHPKYKGKQQAMGATGIAREVAALLDGALIVGANPWFDAGHIDAFLREYGQALSADYHMRDISSVVAGYLAGCSREDWSWPGPWPGPLTSSKLTDVARAVGIDPGSYQTHTALGDTRLTVAIWDRVFA
jgi:hypothetical protein